MARVHWLVTWNGTVQWLETWKIDTPASPGGLIESYTLSGLGSGLSHL